MKSSIITFSLPNGIRCIHQYIPSPVAHCGLTINTGTREELAAEHGMAHFLEHLLFKGTIKRKAYQINNRLENVGGELNAFTAKEETVVHATVLKRDIERAVELIADIVFHSTFPDKEIKKEQEVVIDEINSYKDSPSELIFDDFESLAFEGSSLGNNVLGTSKSIKSFNSAKLKTFVGRTYNTNQMVFSCIGAITPQRFKHLISVYFENIPANLRTFNRNNIQPYQSFAKTVHKSTFQAHCIMGNRAYALTDERRIALHLLVNYLGGPFSTSSLNTLLREQRGLVYNVEANYTPYSDTGLATLYFGTAKVNLSQCLELVRHRLHECATICMNGVKLHRLKKQFIGLHAITAESSENTMLAMGKSLISYNRYEPIEEILKKIESVSANDLLAVANDVFVPDNMSVLIFQ